MLIKFVPLITVSSMILKKYLCLNGYQLYLVENSIRCILNVIFTPSPEILTVRKAPIYLKIPFMNSKPNNCLKTKLSELISKYYPQIDLRISFLIYSFGGLFKF